MLSIKNLFVATSGKEIIKGLDLTIKPGEVHVIMGPNGAGKSTLASVLMGHPSYQITKGQIRLDNIIINKLSADKRARLGLFLAFQYPTEIPGVTISNFLKTAYDSLNKQRIDIIEFRIFLKEKAKNLKINEEFIDRAINEGFSGGEKKKMEMLQLLTLNPKYAIFDETDSGLDIDALKIVGKTINSIRQNTGVLLITHYHRVLKFVKPDFVHVLINGGIVKSGGASLADELEETGYETINQLTHAS